MIKAVIFDFDGVILESASIKTEAFRVIARDYPKEQADALVRYHMEHMGISRHVKFRYFIEKILGEEYTDGKETALAERFRQIVFQRVMACPFVPGALEFLVRNYQKYDFYIASGTPDAEMHEVVTGRGLEKYFREVHGTPAKKAEIITDIMGRHGYDCSEVLFVGDAGTDRDAAAACGIAFVGRNTPENVEVFRSVENRIDDLRQLEELI